MRRAVVILVVLLLILLTGCKSTYQEAEEQKIDYGPGIQILFDSRPDNDKLEIIEDVKTIDDIVLNSATYLMAWELWEGYAESLEDYLVIIRDKQSNN